MILQHVFTSARRAVVFCGMTLRHSAQTTIMIEFRQCWQHLLARHTPTHLDRRGNFFGTQQQCIRRISSEQSGKSSCLSRRGQPVFWTNFYCDIRNSASLTAEHVTIEMMRILAIASIPFVDVQSCSLSLASGGSRGKGLPSHPPF